MEDAPDLGPVVGVWVAPVLRGHQDALARLARRPHLLGIVATVAEDEARLGGRLRQVQGRESIVPRRARE
jgi:hypothetical protein